MSVQHDNDGDIAAVNDGMLRFSAERIRDLERDRDALRKSLKLATEFIERIANTRGVGLYEAANVLTDTKVLARTTLDQLKEPTGE